MPEDLTYKDIWERINPKMSGYGNSYIGQFNSAGAGLDELNSMKSSIASDKYNAVKSQLGAQQGQAVAGGALAVAGGITDILKTTFDLGSIADTSQYENQIEEVGNVGRENFYDFDTLSGEYNRLNQSSINPDYDAIRGKTDAEKAGGILSSTLSGATAGLTVGGPWGALAGAVVGLGSGIVGTVSGDESAKAKQKLLTSQAQLANERAEANLTSGAERMSQYKFRSGISNRADNGGQIERKRTSIEAFARRVLRKPVQSQTNTSGIVRLHKDGGTVIRGLNLSSKNKFGGEESPTQTIHRTGHTRWTYPEYGEKVKVPDNMYDESDAVEFVKNYFQSPGFVRREKEAHLFGEPLDINPDISYIEDSVSAASADQYNNLIELGIFPESYVFPVVDEALPKINERVLRDNRIRSGMYPATVAAHEAGHFNPIFNLSVGKLSSESPFYGNDYSLVPQYWKYLLQPEGVVTAHNKEYNENYSDLIALRYFLQKNGIFDSNDENAQFTEEDYKKLMEVEGAENLRYLQNHSMTKVIEALNEIALLQKNKPSDNLA